MTLRRLITVLVTALLALPLVGGNVLRCVCDPLLAAAAGGGGCCCKGAHADADDARTRAQDTIHRDCCCDSVDEAAPLAPATASQPEASSSLEHAVAFAPLVHAVAAERHTASSLVTPPRVPVHPPTGGALPLLGSVRLRP